MTTDILVCHLNDTHKTNKTQWKAVFCAMIRHNFYNVAELIM